MNHSDRGKLPRTSERYDALISSIDRGEVVLIDGATGTEVERRGVPQLENAWNGGGALSHPEIVQAIHEDYIRAGARIVISNTFATHRSALEDAGVADDFEAYNRRGVELAIAAREHLGAGHVAVAGGLSHWSWIRKDPPVSALHANAIEQARFLADAGADLLMLEMMVDVERMIAVLDAALATGLPVWVGLSCSLDGSGSVVLGSIEGGEPWGSGEPLADAIAAFGDRPVPLVNIMHTDVGIVSRCLDTLRESWSGRVGVYAHSGDYVDKRWIFGTVITPDGYTHYSKEWLSRGVSVLGSCCGTDPEHIQDLAAHLDIAKPV